jgi:hypothetical protein
MRLPKPPSDKWTTRPTKRTIRALLARLADARAMLSDLETVVEALDERLGEETDYSYGYRE